MISYSDTMDKPIPFRLKPIFLCMKIFMYWRHDFATHRMQRPTYSLQVTTNLHESADEA